MRACQPIGDGYVERDGVKVLVRLVRSRAGMFTIAERKLATMDGYGERPLGGPMAIETIVFDLDDTLVAASRSYARALSVLAGYDVDPAAFVAAHRRWWTCYQSGGCTIDELYEGRMRDVGLTGDLAMEANDRFVQAAAAIHWRRGAPGLLRTLRRLRIRTVVLTNGGSRSQREKIVRLAVDKLVDAVVISDEIGQAKPATAAFDAALQAVAGRASTAAAVGDDLKADIEGALAAGLGGAVWVTTSHRKLPDHRIVKVRRLDQVASALGIE
jgi:HAD superfamily hydrolase (TIGR01549 family)